MTKRQLISLKNQVDKISKQLEEILQKDYPETVKVKKSSAAPEGFNTWYEYLEYRRSQSDFHILEWDSEVNDLYYAELRRVAQKLYFKVWCNQVIPGGFTEWMRKDIPEWTE